jgi:hypothetical protein
MSTEQSQQPTMLQRRNQYTDTGIGNKKDAAPDLEATISNLRNASPLLANQIDNMIAERPTGSVGDQNKMWLFLHTQMMYTQKFQEAGKSDDLYAPPGPPTSVSISVTELQSIRKETVQFVENNKQDIADELEFGPSSLKRPAPFGGSR